MKDIRVFLTSRKPRDANWIMKALQVAIEIELYTIPPYLTALWSISDESNFAVKSLRDIVRDEMAHVALVCNILTAIGGKPVLNASDSIPKYPGPIPGNVNPELQVSLSGLSASSIKTFMSIEAPQNPLSFPEEGKFVEDGESFPQIGAFYDAILQAFIDENLTIRVENQLSSPIAQLIVTSVDDVCKALQKIRVEGEGSEASPLNLPTATKSTDPLAHYYRFQELDKLKQLQWNDKDNSYYWGNALSFPNVFPVVAVPPGGYANCANSEVSNLLKEFDTAYSLMLDQLHNAWNGTGQASMWLAIESMFKLRLPARKLMQIEIGRSGTTYGPQFHYLPNP